MEILVSQWKSMEIPGISEELLMDLNSAGGSLDFVLGALGMFPGEGLG